MRQSLLKRGVLRPGLWLALVLAGCAPTTEGREFACDPAAEGASELVQCPGTEVCWGDSTCRTGAPGYDLFQTCHDDVGMPGGPMPTAEPEECTTRFCANGLDPLAGERGALCTRTCEEDADCTGEEQESICIEGACRLQCQRVMDCPMGTQCWFGMSRDEIPSHASCFALQNETLNGARSCTGNMPGGGCELPGWCMQPLEGTGVCSMLCEVDPMGNSIGEMCPTDTACVNVMGGIGQCLKTCTAPEDCTDGSLGCVELTTGNSYCVPDTWNSDVIPSAEGFRMMMPPMMMMTP